MIAARLAQLVSVAWTSFDQIVAWTPPDLRKGPRGSGRDRDAIVDHVLGAETAYGRKLGIRHRQPARDDMVAIAALRTALADALRSSADGDCTVEHG